MEGEAFARRHFLRALGGSAAVACAVACGAFTEPGAVWGDDHTQLRSRPDPGVVPRGVDAGLTPLGVAAERDASLFVPPEAARGRPVPLMVTLHGAGGGRHPGGLGRFRDAADRGVALLLPIARGASWDVIVEGRFGTDVAVIDEALAAAFERIPIDPTAVALAGSSDGASYAISLGLANGGLFPFVIGASPGFVADAERRGTPDVFVSHGRHDPTLPIDRTSGEIVPALREDGYDVTYVEFDGGHELPPTIARRQIGWFLQRAARR